MTINERNIVRRWELMASKDLGIDVNVESREYAKLFKDIFEFGFDQVKGLKWTLPEIRGFAINNEGYYENCSVVTCLDLNHVNMNKEAAKELDWWLMNRRNWFDRYRFAQTV